MAGKGKGEGQRVHQVEEEACLPCHQPQITGQGVGQKCKKQKVQHSRHSTEHGRRDEGERERERTLRRENMKE